MIDVKSIIKRSVEGRSSLPKGGQSGDRNLKSRAGQPTKPGALRAALNKIGYAITSYPDREIGWLPYGVTALRSLLNANHYELVLSSSLPVTAHFIAALAGGRTPWVADLRDLWSQNHNLVRTRLRALSDGMLERATLTKADALTTVSEPLAEKLRQHFPKKLILSIPNAYDEDEWLDIPFGSEEVCTLLYAGQFAEGRRDPELLLQAISEAIQSGDLRREALRVELYCQKYDWLQKMVETYALQDVVRLRGMIQRGEVLLAERRADALMVALWDYEAEEGMYTGKLFEYIGARKPVLAFGGPERSVVEDLVTTSGLGWRCRDAQSLKHRIISLVGCHAQNAQSISLHKEPSQFSSRVMAQKFAALFEEITNKYSTRA